ncbi:MAG: ABC transporter ATP-binding protein, partial [Clostridiales bacterium]|nr:ABC transporter ATP-binding protein [Clostridiales bacterium]
EEEMNEALVMAQAMEFVEKYKNKLDFVIHQGGKNLSGGQRQRLSIARALVKQPEILVLDDSTSALDYATDARLRRAIANSNKKMTTLIVSQRAASILHADKVIVLHDGKMVGYGPHKELIETCDIYQEIYYSQFQKEAVND